MSKWNKVQSLVAEQEKEPEENDEDKPIYEIKEMPEAKLRFKILKPLNYFMRKAEFQDRESKVDEEMLPCPKTRKKYIPLQPFHKSQGSHTPMSHSDMNTTAKIVKGTSMNHMEGGWPEHVKTDLIEHKNKFIRQTCKEDMFKWTVTGLIKKAEKVLKQNNTMNIEEIYFEDLDETGSVQTLEVKTLAKFKDFSGHKRPVSYITWKNCQEGLIYTLFVIIRFVFIHIKTINKINETSGTSNCYLLLQFRVPWYVQ